MKNGFQAATRDQEVPSPGYTVRITESYQDVSSQVLEAVKPEMGFGDRTRAIERRIKEIEQQAEQQHPGQRAEVAEMFAGKTYVLFMYTYIRDVRLVFAPPASIGVFGGDVDNWEWPRHTGDFSFMRAYVAPDGSSAEYSPDNVPYHPKRHIEVQPRGVDEGDYVMLIGYPGRTHRHKTASFLRYQRDVYLPYVVDTYGWEIQQLENAGRDDRAVMLKLTPRIQGLANVEKRSRGQLQGIRRARLVEQREAAERELQAFIEADPARKQRYGNLLSEIDAVHDEIRSTALLDLNLRQLTRSCRLLSIAFTLYDAASERQKPDIEREPAYMDRNFDQTRSRLMLTVRDLHVPTDKKLLSGLLDRIAKVEGADEIEALRMSALNGELRQNYIDRMYQNSWLVDEDFVQRCLEKTPEELRDLDDPFINMIVELYPLYQEKRELDKQRQGQLDPLYGELVTVKQEFLKTAFVPDANGTLRLTYGHVKGYSPEDAVYKSPITRLQGAIDKATGVAPFVLPEKVVALHERREFGPYAHPKLDDVPVCILYDADTTGGNSGSPILNGDGQLVGVNFDRCFEATINDFAWNESYSRSIGVDIRYVLWLTDVVFGADHLLEEMGVAPVVEDAGSRR